MAIDFVTMLAPRCLSGRCCHPVIRTLLEINNLFGIMISLICVILAMVLPSSDGMLKVPAGIIMVKESVLPFKMEMVGPAIDIAIEEALAYGIQFIKHERLYPTWCNAEVTTGYVSDLYHNAGIWALIGPGCSGDITYCGKLASYYNLPLVSGVGDLLLEKEEYPTFTRLSYSLEKQSVFLTAILDMFEWRHLVIIFDTYDVLMRVQGNALRQALREDKRYPRPYDIEFDTTKKPDFAEMLREASRYARVILFLSSGGDLRNFMLTAYDLAMTQGDYAFLTIELFQSDAWGDFSWKRGDSRDSHAKQAYQSLLQLTLTKPAGERWEKFSQEVIFRAKRDYNFTYDEEVNLFVGAFYDGVKYLTHAYNLTLEEGRDPRDGLHVAQKLWNSTLEGVLGPIFIDSIGDKIADYSLLDMTDIDEGIFQVVGRFSGAMQRFVMDSKMGIHWPAGRPPLDVPHCGLQKENPSCNQTTLVIIVTCIVIGAFLIAVLVGAYVYKRMRFEWQLSDMTWKVTWDKINLVLGKSMTSMSRLSLAISDKESTTNASGMDANQIFTMVGRYKGALVAVRKILAEKINIDRKVLLELKMIREVQHDNLTRFLGACVDSEIALLIEYCPKGSLMDILANESINLDWTFRYSLINDVIRGLCYLHESDLKVHGRLKSSNCVVDGRFVLKLTDFGLPSFYYAENKKRETDIHAHFRQKLWQAPELLDVHGPATQCGDVYSFAIILGEVITRAEPYDGYNLEAKDILQRIRNSEQPPFRPKIERSLCNRHVYNLVEKCWDELPERRPTINVVRVALAKITKDQRVTGNILDNLLRRMEQYAENLESLVEDRTRAFHEEKRRSEELLYRVLPKSIADELKQGKMVVPEAYDCVTIYFSDIVGFTAISASSTPMQVIDLLNDLYTCFDAIIEMFDVYKVETIGDAYMVVSGLPVKNGNEHASQIARMSLRLLQAVDTFKIRHRPTEQLKLRIGIHSGACCAGVVGLTMPRYCLFGDTVNTASRMESTGEALRIHLSPSTKEILDESGHFRTSLRGETAMKGKGTVVTYWLEGEHD